MKSTLALAVVSMSLIISAAQAQTLSTSYEGLTSEGNSCSLEVVKCDKGQLFLMKEKNKTKMIMSDKPVHYDSKIYNVRMKNGILSNKMVSASRDAKVNLELELEENESGITGYEHSLNGTMKYSKQRQYMLQTQGKSDLQIFFASMSMQAEMVKDALFEYEVVKLDSSTKCLDMSKSSEQEIGEYTLEKRYCDSMK